MQLKIQVTKSERQAAAELASPTNTIFSFLWAAIFVLLAAVRITVVLLRYGGKTPALLIASRLCVDPLLWFLALAAVCLYAGKLPAPKRQAQYLHGLAMLRTAFICQITAEGVACFNGDVLLGAYTYSAFNRVKHTGNLLLLQQGQSVLLIIPLRCFGSPEQAEKAERFLRQKIMLAQNAPSPLLVAAHPKPLWAFSYWADTTTALSAASIQKQVYFGRQGWARLFRVLAPLGFITCVAMLFLKPRFGAIPFVFVGLLLLLCATGYARYRGGVQGSNLGWVPHCLYNHCTLEISSEGLRIAAPQMEMLLGWNLPYRVSYGPSMAIITLYGSFYACLPYVAASLQSVHAALDYITDYSQPVI